MPSSGFAIGELSRRTGCNIETIRYYERIGLLPRARRSGRYRNYDPADAGRLAFIRRARELGFTLDEVRTLLALAAASAASCHEARGIAAAHLADVRARIADLKRMERTLKDHIRECDAGHNVACPMIESLRAAAAA